MGCPVEFEAQPGLTPKLKPTSQKKLQEFPEECRPREWAVLLFVSLSAHDSTPFDDC